jgi:L-asparagine transporter-like permease
MYGPRPGAVSQGRQNGTAAWSIMQSQVYGVTPMTLHDTATQTRRGKGYAGLDTTSSCWTARTVAYAVLMRGVICQVIFQGCPRKPFAVLGFRQ